MNPTPEGEQAFYGIQTVRPFIDASGTLRPTPREVAYKESQDAEQPPEGGCTEVADCSETPTRRHSTPKVLASSADVAR